MKYIIGCIISEPPNSCRLTTVCSHSVQERDRLRAGKLVLPVRFLHKERTNSPCFTTRRHNDTIQKLHRHSVVKHSVSSRQVCHRLPVLKVASDFVGFHRCSLLNCRGRRSIRAVAGLLLSQSYSHDRRKTMEL